MAKLFLNVAILNVMILRLLKPEMLFEWKNIKAKILCMRSCP